MTRFGAVLSLGFLMLGSVALAADKDHFDIGEAVPVFTLKAINTDVTHGEAYVSPDHYYGPEAKDPKKAILLTFFATYCEPCKKEMPLLAMLYDAYKDKGLQVLSVSIDKEPDKVEFAHALAKQTNAKFPVLSDHFNIVAKRYQVSKLPCVYLLNGEGKVAMVNIGYTDDASKKLVEEIRKTIGVPASEPVPENITTFLAAHPTGGHVEAVAVPGAEPAAATAAPAPAPAAGKPTAAPAADDADDDDKSDKGKGKKAPKKKGKK